MNTNLSKAFEEEFLSFFALYVMNLVFAALTMAIGLAIVVQKLVSQPGSIPTGAPAIPFAVTIVLGGAAFVIGLVWITVTARLLKSVRVVRTAYRQKKKRELTPEDFTGMMVHMMTQYREQKRTVRAMVVICMAGGICYVVQGVLDIGQIIAGVAAGNVMQPVIPVIIAAAISLVIGGVSIRISKYFRRYAKVWDARLDALSRSENELDAMLEQG
jgi:hypothetical protein